MPSTNCSSLDQLLFNAFRINANSMSNKCVIIFLHHAFPTSIFYCWFFFPKEHNCRETCYFLSSLSASWGGFLGWLRVSDGFLRLNKLINSFEIEAFNFFKVTLKTGTIFGRNFFEWSPRYWSNIFWSYVGTFRSLISFKESARHGSENSQRHFFSKKVSKQICSIFFSENISVKPSFSI